MLFKAFMVGLFSLWGQGGGAYYGKGFCISIMFEFIWKGDDMTQNC